MKKFALDGRLLSVAKFVRQGAQFADIGTDHAYLPLALLSEGKISGAVCSDINEGPLESAKANAAECGIADKISFILTDGALGLDNLGITDVAISGMGGELIANIISRALFFRDESIRLILQPMSRQGHLRSYLAKEGFEIFAEDYSYSQGKYYVTLAIRYTGIPYELKTAEAELGREEFFCGSECERGFLLQKRRALGKIRDGKMRGGEDFAFEKLLIDYINKILEKYDRG